MWVRLNLIFQPELHWHPPCCSAGLWSLRSTTMLWKKAGSTWFNQGVESRVSIPRNCCFVSVLPLWLLVQLSSQHYQILLVWCSFLSFFFDDRPKGTQVISPSDRPLIQNGGLAVVECSWARLDDVPFSKISSPHERLRMYIHLLHPIYLQLIDKST